MKLLLDTHVVIWWAKDDAQLSAAARDAIVDSANELLFSSVTAWELAIKVSIGRLDLGSSTAEFVAEVLRRPGVMQLDVSVEHALGVEQLPFHHSDPFDRLLISQAKAEGAALISRDKKISAYEVVVIW